MINWLHNRLARPTSLIIDNRVGGGPPLSLPSLSSIGIHTTLPSLSSFGIHTTLWQSSVYCPFYSKFRSSSNDNNCCQYTEANWLQFTQLSVIQLHPIWQYCIGHIGIPSYIILYWPIRLGMSFKAECSATYMGIVSKYTLRIVVNKAPNMPQLFADKVRMLA